MEMDLVVAERRVAVGCLLSTYSVFASKEEMDDLVDMANLPGIALPSLVAGYCEGKTYSCKVSYNIGSYLRSKHSPKEEYSSMEMVAA